MIGCSRIGIPLDTKNENINEIIPNYVLYAENIIDDKGSWSKEKMLDSEKTFESGKMNAATLNINFRSGKKAYDAASEEDIKCAFKVNITAIIKTVDGDNALLKVIYGAMNEGGSGRAMSLVSKLWNK